MLKKWLSLLCIFLPAALAILAAHAMADSTQTVCGSAQKVSGVDVSDYQNSQSWTSTIQSGRQFAFVKATQGATFVSPEFQKDWNGTKEAGILRGAYHYFVPSDDVSTQVQNFINAVGSIETDDLPPMLDLEATDSVPNSQIVADALSWLEQVRQQTGRNPIIYTNPGYWAQIGNPSGFGQYPLFIADYGVNCPTVPASWNTWTFWQHVIGSVPGILNNVDQDYFNGALAALRLL